jgi:uncharacterized protein YbjQ (UPF0145 family)
MEQIVITLVLILLGLIVGSIAEQRHYSSIKAREKKLLRLPAVTIQRCINPRAKIKKAELVTGSVVISLDYFKRILAGFRNIVGGRVKSYETLIDRGRREAVLRMKESAKGANMILNVRLETSSIGQNAQQRKSIGSIEVLAYGTAVYLEA